MKKYFFNLSLLILICYACSDPTSVGASLLDIEDLPLEYTDSVQLSLKTVTEDSIRSMGLNTNIIGRLEDPVFGSSECLVYTSSSFSFSNPNFEEAELDSIIMVLPLDTSGYYGEQNVSHKIEVIQLTENIETTIYEDIGIDSIYSFSEISFDESNVIGSLETIPNYEDSIEVFSPALDEIIKTVPQLRIPIDLDFGQYYIENDTFVSSDSIFREEVKGFVIKSTPQGSSTIGFNLRASNSQQLLFYYTKADTLKQVYGFDLGDGLEGRSAYFQYYNHTFSPEIEDALTTDNSEKLYSGSMAGPNIEVDLTPIYQFEDDIINHATLDLYLNEEGQDLESYPPVMYFLAYYKTQSGDFVQIRDVDQSSFSAIENSIGGNLVEDENTGKRMYSFQITSHIVALLNDVYEGNTGESIFLRTLLKSQRPFRSVIHGNDDSEFKPRLKLVITNPE